MGLFWKAPINKTVHLLENSGKRELFWYGITIGQIGFGVLASVERQPTKRAADLPVCTCSTRPTPTALSIDPNCPVHGSASR